MPTTDTAQIPPVPSDDPLHQRAQQRGGLGRARWRDGIPAALAVVVLHAAAGVAALRGLGVVEPEPVITPPAITGVLVAEASRKLAETPPAPTPAPPPPPRELPKADPEVVPPPPPPPKPEPAPEPPPKPEPAPKPVPPPKPKPKPKPRPKPDPVPPVKAPPTQRSVTVPEEPAPVAQEPAPAPVPPPAPPPPAPPPVAAAPATAPAPPAPAPAPPVAPPISDAAHLNNPAPVYPTRSRRLGEEGRVVLEVLILPNGRVGEIKVKRTSGHAALDQAALEAVQRWKFVPAKRGDEAIPYRYELPVIFSLRS